MELENLRFEVREGVAHVTIDRPGAANALNLALARELMHVAMRCDRDPGVRAVLLTGEGKLFCAGGDLREFAGRGEQLPLHVQETTTCLHAAISRFHRMEAPLVAAVNGAAGGAGMSLACACDLVLASETARFTMAYTAVGLAPDGGSTYFLVRLVGLRRALELVLTNRTLSAAEALDWGIVNRVVPPDRLLPEAEELARSLARGAPAALAAARRLLHSGLHEGLESQMELESRAISATAGTADGREGIAAFLEKRAPRFTGRS